MQLLIWKGKHGDQHFDVSTEEKKAEALRKLFATMNDQSYWDFYADLRDPAQAPQEFEKCHTCDGTGRIADKFYRQHKREYDTEKGYYEKALEGDTKAIERLLFSRRDHEYEWVEYTEAAG